MKFTFALLPLFLLGCTPDKESHTINIPERAVWIEFSTSFGDGEDRARDAIFAKSGTHLRLEPLGDDMFVTLFKNDRRIIRKEEERTISKIEGFTPFDGFDSAVTSAVTILDDEVRSIPVRAYYTNDEGYRIGIFLSRLDQKPLRMGIIAPDGKSEVAEYFWIDETDVLDDWFEVESDVNLLRIQFKDQIERARHEFLKWKHSSATAP